MQLTQADLIGEMRTSAPKPAGTAGLIEAAEEHGRVRFAIEEICDGTWSIGGELTNTVAARVPSGNEQAVVRSE
jgi:hypothetical protein